MWKTSKISIRGFSISKRLAILTLLSLCVPNTLLAETALSEITALSELGLNEEENHLSQSSISMLHHLPHVWKLKKDRKGIKVYLSKVEGSKFNAVLTVMQVKSSAESLAALVADFENCPNWAAMCKQARQIRRLSDSEVLVYSLNNAPFPVRDRDVTAMVTWHYDQASGKIFMLSQAINGILPPIKGVIRVESATSEWHFTPLENGLVQVENYAHIDPNGAVPAWVTNMMSLDAPYRTMKKMRRIVESGKYDDVTLSFFPTQ